jgi:hypothetical protein
VAFDFSIIIKNDTGAQLRIDSFEDNCGKVYIKEISPLYLAPGESIKFNKLVPIIHHYKMCANGTCEGSALGMNHIVNKYILQAILKKHCLSVIQKPSIWPGIIKCNKAQYRI